MDSHDDHGTIRYAVMLVSEAFRNPSSWHGQGGRSVLAYLAGVSALVGGQLLSVSEGVTWPIRFMSQAQFAGLLTMVGLLFVAYAAVTFAILFVHARRKFDAQ